MSPSARLILMLVSCLAALGCLTGVIGALNPEALTWPSKPDPDGTTPTRTQLVVFAFICGVVCVTTLMFALRKFGEPPPDAKAEDGDGAPS